MPAFDFDPTPAYPVRRSGIRAVPLPGSQWRVTREHGDVLGYVELVRPDGDGEPVWRGKRMLPRQARFQVLGDFGSAADALDVVRTG